MFIGSGVAIVTPFNSNGSVNFESLEKLLEFQIKNSTDAIIICGSTGEAATLTEDERFEVIKFTVDTVKQRIPVIAGTGSNSTSQSIKLSLDAQKAGADGLLIVTPYYNKPTQQGLIAHYEEIAKAVDIDIILYNVPSRTGVNMLPETVRTLSMIDNITGIKEASSDITQIAKIVAICPESFNVYSGNDSEILPTLAIGGRGVISVVANILPRETEAVIARFFEGHVPESRKAQLELLPIIDAMFIEVNPVPVKQALNIMGMNVGSCRKPLVDMSESNLNKLKEVMADYKLS